MRVLEIIDMPSDRYIPIHRVPVFLNLALDFTYNIRWNNLATCGILNSEVCFGLSQPMAVRSEILLTFSQKV